MLHYVKLSNVGKGRGTDQRLIHTSTQWLSSSARGLQLSRKNFPNAAPMIMSFKINQIQFQKLIEEKLGD